MKFKAEISEKTIEVEVNPRESTFQIGKKTDGYELIKQNGRYLLRVGTKLYKIDNISHDGSMIEFSINGEWHNVTVKDEQDLLLDKLGFKTGNAIAEGILKAPMPGKILDILVREGDEVEVGQSLVILEAMKMENELKSPVKGKVIEVSAEVGQSLEKNTFILEIESIG